MYNLESKNRNSDYSKRQILTVQEKFKVFVPAFAVLAAGLLALNIANAVHNFMAVYVCVIVNLIGICAGCGLAVSLAKANKRQKNLFEQLAENAGTAAEQSRVLKYVSDTAGVLKRADKVRAAETESEYVISPVLPEYKHRLFTRYDFRTDFGKLTLPKSEFAVREEDGGVSFVSDDTEFKFAAVKE